MDITKSPSLDDILEAIFLHIISTVVCLVIGMVLNVPSLKYTFRISLLVAALGLLAGDPSPTAVTAVTGGVTGVAASFGRPILERDLPNVPTLDGIGVLDDLLEGPSAKEGDMAEFQAGGDTEGVEGGGAVCSGIESLLAPLESEEGEDEEVVPSATLSFDAVDPKVLSP